MAFVQPPLFQLGSRNALPFSVREAARSLSVSRLPHSCHSRGDIARTSLKISYDAASIGAPSDKGRAHGRKINVDVLDSGVRVVALGACRKDDHGLAGLDDRETFTNGCNDRPSRDRKTRRGMVGKMDRRPSSQLMIVGQCRENLEREFLWVDQRFSRQPVINRHDQFATVLKKDCALHQTIVGKGKPAERRIDFARRHRFELVQQRKLDPIHVEIELAFKVPHERQGQLEKTAPDEPDPKAVRLTEGGFPAIIQRGAKHQRCGLHTNAQFRTQICQLNAPTGSHEEPPAYLMLQGTNRFGHRGLSEVKPLSRLAEM
jgi:hypothetical protein